MYSETTSKLGLKHLLLKYVLSATAEAASPGEAASVLGLDPEQG